MQAHILYNLTSLTTYKKMNKAFFEKSIGCLKLYFNIGKNIIFANFISMFLLKTLRVYCTINLFTINQGYFVKLTKLYKTALLKTLRKVFNYALSFIQKFLNIYDVIIGFRQFWNKLQKIN